MWIDAHAHLADLSDDHLASVVDAAECAGVVRVVNTATCLDSSQRVLAQCRRHPLLWPAVGVSPFDAAHLPDGWRERLAWLAADPAVVALGEAGLDATSPAYPSMDSQTPLFESQVALSIELGLPLVVHSRGAERDVAERCRRLGAKRVLFHCFTGDRGALDTILADGYMVSLSGIVTYPNAGIARLADGIPLERLLVETDSPYLSPEPHRGTVNEPARVTLVGARVAGLRGMTPEALAAAVRANAERFFVRSAPG